MSPATFEPLPTIAAPSPAARVPRAIWIALTLLALLSAALAGALAVRLFAPAPGASLAAPVPVTGAALLAASDGEPPFQPLSTVAPGLRAGLPDVPAAPAAVTKPAGETTQRPAAAAAPRRPVHPPARAATSQRVAYAPAAPAHAHARAAACTSCGVVESIAAVRARGPASGLGAVAGGVLGGVLGNQVGGGNGRKAMTVLGAVGGGLAGHEVEKRLRGATVYDVRVRMDDGSRRTVRREHPPAEGSRIVLPGRTA